jgi:hypothetical protein
MKNPKSETMFKNDKSQILNSKQIPNPSRTEMENIPPGMPGVPVLTPTALRSKAVGVIPPDVICRAYPFSDIPPSSSFFAFIQPRRRRGVFCEGGIKISSGRAAMRENPNSPNTQVWDLEHWNLEFV